ncbi:LysM peptidoglycan-binding domain-containing protein [Acidisoma cellulosilytica]|uniref:LysM peptidoglycan-binding domain-containing protein n=1 Tax=Acidisoma cellulosilyticum TaxID=2802395 RepID=A0A964E310_9PROT|nr:Ig-like domain-containing protein [Acidisoma cellulosilyticum]MCB8879363.1 LysM peptidoglycan-binding domain-containing protein [Acidisoma cellulosilyticum]
MTEVTQNVPSPSERPSRPLGGFALAALCVLGAGALYLYENHGQLYPQPAAPVVTATAVAPAATAAKPTVPAQTMAMTMAAASPSAPLSSAPLPAVANPAAPSVDVVRVDKNGDLVMAGRAAPDEKLTVQNGDTTIGTVTADDDGQWVFLPDTTLPSGVHQLSVSGAAAKAGDSSAKTTVLLNLPASGGTAGAATGQNAGPMVVLAQGNAPPRLLEGPSGHSGPVGLDIVQYDEQGRIRFTGHAEPGHSVRLYVNNKAIGDATADAKGTWSMIPAQDLKPGLYRLRTDELTATGKVAARSEVPFARASLSQSLAAGQSVVQPGDCLWTIARQNYGRGVQYTAIFVKNMDQIRDPNKIYPGQVFHMPSQDEAAHAPDVSTIRKLKRGETSQG